MAGSLSLNIQNPKKKKPTTIRSGMIRKRGDGYDEGEESDLERIQAKAAPFLMWSRLNDSSNSVISTIENDRLHFRTGRWSSEEEKYVDELIRAFEASLLPLPIGVKLNEFLRDMIMCKTSRLTKKMKNAKLSSRSYRLNNGRAMDNQQDQGYESLSIAQDNFLRSIPSEGVRIVLRFNMSRMWRMHFFNLALQVNYDSVVSNEWQSSLNTMKDRVAEAEDTVRKARRAKMDRALKRDSYYAANSVGTFIAGTPRSTVSLDSSSRMDDMKMPPATVNSKDFSSQHAAFRKDSFSTGSTNNTDSFNTSVSVPLAPSSAVFKEDDKTTCSKDSGHSSIVVSTNSHSGGNRNREQEPMEEGNDLIYPGTANVTPQFGSVGDEFSIGFLDLDEDWDDQVFNAKEKIEVKMKNNGSFLAKVMEYIQKEQLPFHHIDVWIPVSDQKELLSLQNASQASVRMCHGGYVTRSDLESNSVINNLQDFGHYSRKFSFAIGAGMPGRVISSLTPSWEVNVQDADPNWFERAAGAKTYGIRSVIGIPVNSSSVGTVVLGMYSLFTVPKDIDMIRKCYLEFQQYSPEPKWSIAIDTSQQFLHQQRAPETQQASPLHRDSTLVKVVPMEADIKKKTGPAEVECTVENEIADLLAQNIPLSPDSSMSQMLSEYTSLRLTLLSSLQREVNQHVKDNITVIKKSYESYGKVVENKADIAKLLVNDWKFLTKSQGKSESLIDMQHTNYGNPNTAPHSSSQVTQSIHRPLPARPQSPREPSSTASVSSFNHCNPDIPLSINTANILNEDMPSPRSYTREVSLHSYTSSSAEGTADM